MSTITIFSFCLMEPLQTNLCELLERHFSVLTGQIPLLLPNQQCQSSEGREQIQL